MNGAKHFSIHFSFTKVFLSVDYKQTILQKLLKNIQSAKINIQSGLMQAKMTVRSSLAGYRIVFASKSQ